MKKIYGGLDVTHNLTTKGKRTVQDVNSNQFFDANGTMNIDTYTPEEIQQILSIMPLSKYGDYTFLPAGVNGNFIGASENIGARYHKLQLENDGTLVYLRGGTNGSTYGVYYSSIKNIVNLSNLNSVNTNTIREYKPGYFKSTQFAGGLFNSDSSLVFGYTRGTTAQDNTFFFSYTNGTLDDTQHNGFTIQDDGVVFRQNGSSPVFAMLGLDNAIYVFSTVLDTRLRLIVNKVIPNGTTGTVTYINNWTTKTFYSQTLSEPDIVLNNRVQSANIADKPYLLIPSSAIAGSAYMTPWDIFVAQDPVSKKFRLRVSGDGWVASVNFADRPQHNYSFDLDFNARTATLDAGNDINGKYQAPLVVTDTGSDYVTNGTTYNIDPLYYHNGGGNLINSYYYNTDGIAMAISCPNLAEALLIQRSQFPKQSIYNNLNVRAVTSTEYISGSCKLSFGSSIGSNICGLEIISNTCTKQNSRNARGTLTNSYAVHNPDASFIFKSLDYGTIRGYAPTTDRDFVSNNTTSFITTCDSMSARANGGILIWNQRYSTAISYDDHLNGTGTISIDSTIMTNFKNAEYAKVNTSTYPINNGAIKNCILYIPQQSDMPAFSLMTTITNNNDMYVRVVEVTVPARSGNISSVVFSRLVYEGVMTDNPFNVIGNSTMSPASTGLCIYDIGTHYVIGGGDPLNHSTVGNSGSLQFRGLVNKSTKQMQEFIPMATKGTGYTNNGTFIGIPGYGFGVQRQIDGANKICFDAYGTNLQDYQNWTVQTPNMLALVTQDVAEGFIVYFTEDTPVLMSGKSFTLPIQNIDLKTIKANPANSTFHVYVTMKQGIAQYLISEKVIAEAGSTAYTLFWIGTITTNSTQIASINITKRDRLDIFGASLASAGSSFPVSYGLPSQTGTINW